jgi:alpha-galactosidase
MAALWPCLLAAQAPPNEAARLAVDRARGRVALSYHGGPILSASLAISGAAGERTLAAAGAPILAAGAAKGARGILIEEDTQRGERESVSQRVTFRLSGARPGERIVLHGSVDASPEAFPAETLSPAQSRFPYIRTSVGLSRNLRNNAVYDRRFDWELEGPAEGATLIDPSPSHGERLTFSFTAKGDPLELRFRPRYYQKHKNIPFFEPWTYKIRQDSVTGWCSWWAFRTNIKAADVALTAKVLSEKLKDYGFEYMQIDDGYQSDYSGLPDHWLKTNPERFPDGLASMYQAIKSNGLKPAIWVNVHFGEQAFVRQHPSWFLSQPDGQPHKGPWIDYAIDGSSPEAIDNIVRPLYRGLKQMGWQYVKIDTLRHLLYDAINRRPEYFAKKGADGVESFRNVLRAARQELGPETFILACWGVLPEAVGIADGMRIGGDGYEPTSLQQYNSWNGVVWRNDPDHVDILPRARGMGMGNVTQTAATTADPRDPIIRPVIASLASGSLLLSDRPEVYQDERTIEGARRSAPVLFSVPGQLYDYDASKTSVVIKGDRRAVTGGSGPSPIDAMRSGEICPWWLVEIDRPFDHWNVLARLSFGPLPATTVKLADLGLRAEREYIVYEFWSRKLIGVFKGEFPSPAQTAKEVRIYSIHEKLDRPQVISTNRHISQGGVDLADARWDPRTSTLTGKSAVVKNDLYALTIFVPSGRRVGKAQIGGQPAAVRIDGSAVEVSITPGASSTVSWTVSFVNGRKTL